LRLFLSIALDPRDPAKAILLGEINTDYIRGTSGDYLLPIRAELCIVDDSNRVIYASHRVSALFLKQLASSVGHSHIGQLEWSDEGEEYLASYWSPFLKPMFHVSHWTIVLSESKADVLAPVADFKRFFLPLTLLAFLVVLFLSVVRIRQNLTPLERLQEITRRIGMGDFSARVAIGSGDEFEDLAESFNTMAIRLSRQFGALATIAEIDSSILASLDREEIADTILNRMNDVIFCEGVSVGVIDAEESNLLRMHTRDSKSEGGKSVEEMEMTPEDLRILRKHPEALSIDAGEVLPRFLAPLASMGFNWFLVLPVFAKHQLSAIISLGYLEAPKLGEEDLAHARQMADQVAVAFSNTRLLEELDHLNWGTLTALARAIDAKSPWTAGHSERTTELALKIGRVMILSKEELDTLHRGGLLHDIGKIGIPPQILDKSGELSAEESRLMREHVRMGARILEPIAAFADVIPIVLQHHEWFDGTGYPDGLVGSDIHLAARIFAVADCFDSLNSDRPYRSSLGREQATAYIVKGSGGQFDPKVVKAFLAVMKQEERESREQARSAVPQDPR
jgi:putative nucleotidyltransferase with HDIG domain